MKTLQEEVLVLLADSGFRRAVLSGPRKGGGDASGDAPLRATVRPAGGADKAVWQLEVIRGVKSFHENLGPDAMARRIAGLLETAFRQALFQVDGSEHQFLVSSKGKVTHLTRPAGGGAGASDSPASSDFCQDGKSGRAEHNRVRHYLIPEGKPVPWMVEVGIMNRNGGIVSQYYRKFRQINRYLEFIRDVLPGLPEDRPLHVVDFGCGKAYLGFALYDWLVNSQGRDVRITGLDLKHDVIENSRKLAARLGFRGMEFRQGNIADWTGDGGVDMVICLHACDTATDAALAKAALWGAPVILAVPCCHKELIQKIGNSRLEALLSYGLLRERFGSIATDTLRALALEVLGYRTDIMEFIETEHTPKNTLIRAVRGKDWQMDGGGASALKAARRYLAFRDELGVSPWLESALGERFSSALAAAAAAARP